jgi:predicted amidophosphoribosyltransferase
MGRLSNSNKLFEVRNSEEIKGKNILLLDDIITTGATIESAAFEIFEAGCQSLSVAAIASTV